MTITAAQHDSTSTPDSTDGTDTALDRRRDKWQIAQQDAAAAKARITALDAKLDTLATEQTDHETALQEAIDRQAELKAAIKASSKERDHVLAARKRADRDATNADERARAAEAKYDKALLAEMLRQQKRTDLSAHDGNTDAPTTTRTTTAARRRPATRTSGRPASTTEKAPVARSTARRTAATVTARKASS